MNCPRRFSPGGGGTCAPPPAVPLWRCRCAVPPCAPHWSWRPAGPSCRRRFSLDGSAPAAEPAWDSPGQMDAGGASTRWTKVQAPPRRRSHCQTSPSFGSAPKVWRRHTSRRRPSILLVHRPPAGSANQTVSPAYQLYELLRLPAPPSPMTPTPSPPTPLPPPPPSPPATRPTLALSMWMKAAPSSMRPLPSS